MLDSCDDPSIVHGELSAAWQHVAILASRQRVAL